LQALRPSDQLTFPMAINPNGGNVGIGNANPAFKLDVNGTAHVSGQMNVDGNIVMGNGPAIWGINTSGGSEQAFWPRSGNGTYINYGSNGFYIRNNASTNTMTMAANGIVQVGVATSDALLNVGLAPFVTTYTAYGKLTTGGATGTNYGRSVQLSVHTTGSILAPEFDVDSDIRIKTALHPTDSVKDLETLMGIEVTNYHFKDTVANGDIPQKKVIAQQVETVYPQAVHIHTGVVPDIYQNAEIKGGWIMLATDLKAGERVRLVFPSGESVEEVLEVRDGAFRTRLKSAEEKTFVYGREVSDFHTVDYDAIAMLNVSATQQLKREKDAEIQTLRDQSTAEIKTLQGENAALRRELAAKEQSVEARLIALEQRLSKGSAPETVSIKQGGQ